MLMRVLKHAWENVKVDTGETMGNGRESIEL